MINDNLYAVEGFHWWLGVVEDREDPLLLGRCRVRILGYHTKDKAILPTEDLPWALPIQPINSAGVSGVGVTPLGVVPGTWVVGFFADGASCQQPVMMGTFGGVPQKDYHNLLSNQEGFQDPDKVYPLRTHMDEPDTNRLARNQKIRETIVQDKRQERETGINSAFGVTWNEPKVPYAARYPFNKVTYSESGHVIEIDDTPGAERLHTYHRTGTFEEIHPNGTVVRKIVGDNVEIIEANENVLIKGRANITVEGNCNLYVKNDLNIQVDGNTKLHSHGNIELKAGKNITLAAKQNVNVHADVNINQKAGATMALESGGPTNINAAIMSLISNTRISLTSLVTSIASPITNVNILSFIGITMRIPPLPVIPGVALPVPSTETISEKSPTEKRITPKEFILTQEERANIEMERFEAGEMVKTHGETAFEFQLLKQQELDSGELTSAPAPQSEIDEAESEVPCGAAKIVIDAAKQDLGILETGTKLGNSRNYGGKVGGGELPVGQAGRIDQMISNTSLNNQAQVKASGTGYPWCAAAVTTWWKAAGLPTPPEGSASCAAWGRWARANGYFSDTPKPGAAILYGTAGSENHIGLVVEVSNGEVRTIEGNTKSGEFNREGCGVFFKKPNPNRIVGYVHIPNEEDCVEVQPLTTDDTCVTPEMKQYIEKLAGTIPEKVRQQLPEVVCKFEINTPLRMSHFLSQCSHESANFKIVEERLGYSAKRLRVVFPKYFQNDQIAKDYENNPERIANRVYANRIGNGNEQSGDGYKYRGRGYIQLTGRSNYAEFNKFIPEDCVASPDIIADKYPLLSAAWFWSKRNLNSRADRGENIEVVRQVTKLVNGGENGLKDRQEKFDNFISLA